MRNVDFIADETAMQADEFKTEQVVRNYLTNAIHHVGNEKRIEVKIVSMDGKVCVSVFNSGKPIPKRMYQNCGINFIKWIKHIHVNIWRKWDWTFNR